MARIGNIEGKIAHHLIADKCPICKKMCEIEVQFKQKIFVFGLPLFPHQKYKIIKCKSCKGIIKEKNAPSHVKHFIAEEFPKAPPIKAAYTGSVIFGGIIIMALVVGIKTGINNSNYIDEPQIGDQYIIHYEDPSAIFNKDRYTKWKVVAFSDAHISFIENAMESSDLNDLVISDSGLGSLWMDEDTFSMIQEELKKMNSIVEDYRIEEIVRKED